MRKHVVLILTLIPILLAATALDALAGGKQIVNVSDSPHVKFRTVGIDEARWTNGFWADRWDMDRRVTIPTMKQVMEMPTNSATFHNLRVAAGEVQGEFFGNNWSDGDCYKWIEAAASIYALTRDPELDRSHCRYRQSPGPGWLHLDTNPTDRQRAMERSSSP